MKEMQFSEGYVKDLCNKIVQEERKRVEGKVAELINKIEEKGKEGSHLLYVEEITNMIRQKFGCEKCSLEKL